MIAMAQNKNSKKLRENSNMPPNNITPALITTMIETQGSDIYNGKCELIDPSSSYKGKSYSEWVADWVNWFFGKAPDRNNGGPVVFLKQFPSLTVTRLTAEQDSEDTPSIEKNDPNVMIGENRLEIFSDQAVLFPAIMAYWAASDPTDTEEILRRRVRSDLDNGDNPPKTSQISINGDPIYKAADEKKMSEHRVETSLFPLVISESEYGETYKDYVEYPLAPGSYSAVASGYYFMLKDFEAGKQYIIHSRARGRTTERGEYYAELLYQIVVRDSKERTISPKSGIIPYNITKRLYNKFESQQKYLTVTERKKILDVIRRSRTKPTAPQ
jgi:hypothetical protein